MVQIAENFGRSASEGWTQKVGQQSSGAERDSEGALPRSTTPENKSQINNIHSAASVFCVLHAAFASYSLSRALGPNTDSFDTAFLYYTLVFAWLGWLLVLPASWSLTERKWWKLLVPLGLGALALLPVFAHLTAVFAFLIHGPGL